MTYRVGLSDEPAVVACRADQSVLDACLRAGVWLPNSCNQGTCGTCRIRLVSGEVDHRASPTSTLPLADRADGWLLTCQAAPIGDVVLDRPAGSIGQPAHPLRNFDARVAAVEGIGADIRRLRLELAEPLAFSAGQHVQLVVPGTEHARAYSMANPPEENTSLELHVRREPGGLASERWVFGSVAVGELVTGLGPLGEFGWDASTDGPVVMLAGGTGIAPLLSMLRSALPASPHRSVTVYHGARRRADLYAADALNALAKSFDGLRWVGCVRGDPPGAPGLIDRFLTDHPSCRGFVGYLCGSEGMVDGGAQAFKRRRMSPRAIHRERFLPHPTG
jgi:CDP-4-dehydro-6-deoxyglucose reductase/3-phenylpropionate/trans-cinnamate dioxygenase ferredoxin reductase subunit/phenol hydroxylase P5 protein